MFKKRSIITLVLVGVGMVGTVFKVKSAREVNLKHNIIKFDFEKINMIDVETDNVPMEIISTNEKVARVELIGEESRIREFTADINGTTLVVEVDQKRQKFFSEISYLKIYLPKKVYQSINIETDNGGITAENIDVTSLFTEADYGDINLTNIDAGNVKITSDKGEVNLIDVEGTLGVEADNGSISLITNDIDRDIDFETENGGIIVKSSKQ